MNTIHDANVPDQPGPTEESPHPAGAERPSVASDSSPVSPQMMRYLQRNGTLTLQERTEDGTWRNVPVVYDPDWNESKSGGSRGWPQAAIAAAAAR